MSSIRRQSIISSVMVYMGFALGLFNTYLFTREGGFTPAQYGLIGTFIALANIMFAVANFGMPAYIAKFFPYYKNRLEPKQNDQMTWAFLLPIIGFCVVVALGYFFRGVVYQVFSNSPELPKYYYWLLPFGFGLTLFLILEAYAIQERKSVLSNFLKEVFFRLLQTILIVCTFFGFINGFDAFIKLYSFTYIGVALVLFGYFIYTKRLYFKFSPSIVTRRFFSKIVTLCSFVWGGTLVYNIAAVFDTIVLAAVLPNGLVIAGIFTLAQNIASLIQAPQRAVVSASIGPLSQAWKEKNFQKINLIYHRSSINLLLFSCAMFTLIWLNFDHGVQAFNLNPIYQQAKYAFLFIGLTRIIDLGTGVNAQIIGTSTFWRFEFGTGLLLLALSLPLNFLLTRQLGVIGPAISNLVAFTIYNAVRYVFLWKKLNMQPFTFKTLQTIVLTVAAFAVCYFAFDGMNGFAGIILRSAAFSFLFISGALMLKLSPDIQPVWQTVKRKLTAWKIKK